MDANAGKAATRGKRVCVATWFGGTNYGTNFQAFATLRVLQGYGYDASIVAFCVNPYARRLMDRVKLTLSSLGLLPLAYAARDAFMPLRPPKQKKFRAFLKESCKFKPAYTRGSLERIAEETDVFISGSDQIWNPNSFSPLHFLIFAKDKKRVSYAPSIGSSAIPDERKGQMRDLLMKYQHISVREETAVKALQELTGRGDIVQALDPTFLLTKEDWLDVAEGALLELELPERYIFAYLLGDDLSHCKAKVEDVMAKTGIRRVMLVQANNSRDIKSFVEGCRVCKDAGPKEFLRLLSACDLVCTNSFHGAAFSINFKKPFVTFSDSKNLRVNDLLGHYGLKDQFYANGTDKWLGLYKEANAAETTGGGQFTKVHALLDADRERSRKYLIEAIEL